MGYQSFYNDTVSVIIPCYNHGHFLTTAIDSVLAQTYKNIEIIVVDDGSSDNTKEVAQSYNGVRYIYKENGGLSAARNTGIAESKGEYLLFLDADDWLYPDALEVNLQYLKKNKEAAFASGAHTKIFIQEKEEILIQKEIIANPYEDLLSRGNFIGVPAAVLYRAWAFEKVLFDVSLKACEDFDVYLKLARSYPVAHHTELVAAYRLAGTNMSSDTVMMLTQALKVLQRQKSVLRNKAERVAYRKGIHFWKKYYCYELYTKLKAGTVSNRPLALYTFLKHRPVVLLKYLLHFR